MLPEAGKRRKRGICLTPEAQALVQSRLLEVWIAKKISRKFTRESKAEILGLSVSTVDNILRGRSVDRPTILLAFKHLRLAWDESYAYLGQADEAVLPIEPTSPRVDRGLALLKAACAGATVLLGLVATAQVFGSKPPEAVYNRPGSPGIISGTKPAFIDYLDIEVRSEFNVPLDNWAVGGSSNDWDLPFTTFADGRYILFFSAPASLRRRVVVDYKRARGVSGVDVSLSMGDIDRNNKITQAEVDTIGMYIGRKIGDECWTETVRDLGCQVFDCDLNQDGKIARDDYLLAVGNVGRIGN